MRPLQNGNTLRLGAQSKAGKDHREPRERRETLDEVVRMCEYHAHARRAEAERAPDRGGVGDVRGHTKRARSSRGLRERRPRGDRAQPAGPRIPQGQVTYRWPNAAEIEQTLAGLAAELYGTEEERGLAFRVQDRALLESAAAQPEYPYYLTFDEKLAALFRSLVANHALVDGNKRLALVVLHGTLLVNGRVWLWDDGLAEEFVLACAKSAPAAEDIAAVIAVYTAPIELLRPDTFEPADLREALRLLNPRPPTDSATAVEALQRGGVAELRALVESGVSGLARGAER
jgi:death on curing protein